MGSRNLEDDARLLVRDRGLVGKLIGKGISPGKVDSNLRKSELEEFELAKVLVE